MSTRPIHEIEAKWQARWEAEKTYEAKDAASAGQAEKFYGLVEFPYPSGDGLHVGHPRSYTAIDLVTRKRRMEGKNVLYPMGWDAFGLPTENFAIKHKIPPEEATRRNVGTFTRQTKSLGFGFDWSREINTTDPGYYKWTQWQFLQFVKAGLAYKAKSTINWCPKCKIGLANEEAQGGVCERCGTPVEKREKAQWMIKITKYADRLIDDLSTVNYLDKIAKQQIDWIGRSEGAEIIFRMAKYKKIIVATTNASKLARAQMLLRAVLPEIQVVSPADVGLEMAPVEEGSNLLENARAKAASLVGKTDLPVLGMDTGLAIQGEEQLDIASPKRNALGGRDEATLTQQEKAVLMDEFWRGIARKHGGEVEGAWHDAHVLRLPDGTEFSEQTTREIILTDHHEGEMDINLPVHSLYKIKATGRYAADQIPQEVIFVEFGNLTKSLQKLCSTEVRVFTTRPDTIFGVTYVVLAPEHPLVQSLIQQGRVQNLDEVKSYISSVKDKTDIERTSESKEKTGVALKGVEVTHPFTNLPVPVWIADYVLSGYGTGAVMAVPAHDERDFAFAQKFGLPVKDVVVPYIELGGVFTPRAGKERLNRDVVTIIIHRKDTDSYLLLTTPDGRVMFAGGGIEAGETPEQAVLRETKEETGYENVLSVQMVCPGLYGYGYQERRDKNLYYFEKAFLVEVEGEPTIELSEHEKALNDKISWHKAEELDTLVNLDHQRYMWNWYRDQKFCFTGEGVTTKSDFLNDLRTDEAKKVCIQALEARGAGKGTKTFRLRDWVFSRQRYWGEPIPLVHCDACANTKQKALLIHGFEGDGQGNWFPWMKTELEKQGFEVLAPSMTDADHPELSSWMSQLQSSIDQLGEHDIIIGHSLGSKAALHLVEKAQKKIKALFLIASTIGMVDQKKWDDFKVVWEGSDIEMLRRFCETPFSWEKVSSLVEQKHLVISLDDPYIPPETHEVVPAGWYVQRWNGYRHFNQKQLPELLELILTSKNTGWVPVADTQLPVTLPPVEAYEPTDTGESPLASIPEWANTTCPTCGGPATRETDTMPNWAGSSWYFLRYCDPKNGKEFASAEALKYWMPVDLYNGGMEHTTLHLLYSRFWHKFLYDMGYIPKECGSEPYRMRRSHNMILGEGGIKMSKSKGNVINPDDVVKDYGADVLRVYEMFIGPYDQMAMWDTKGIEGVRRFLDKVWNVLTTSTDLVLSTELETLYHQTIKKVGEGIDNLQFNTCVSQLMILTNAFQELGGVPEACKKGYLQLVAPFAPHLASELWEMAGYTDSLHHDGWPAYDTAKLTSATFELVVQINGKVRDRFQVDSDISEEDAKARALASENVQKWLEGKEPKKVIYIKGRLITIVI